MQRGVYALAIRTEQGADSRLLGLLERVVDDAGAGPEQPARWHRASLNTLLDAPGAAALLPPIPLWLVDVPVAVALLTGKLFCAGFADTNAWHTAFAARGLRRTREQSGWVITAGPKEDRLDALEVGKLELGVLFGGISPDAVADVFAEHLAPSEITDSEGARSMASRARR